MGEDNGEKLAQEVAKDASKKVQKKLMKKLVALVIANIFIILKIILGLVLVLLIASVFNYIVEVVTAENTPKQIYETLEVEDIKELVKIVGNEEDGYHLEYVEDIDQKIEQIVDVLERKSGVYTLTENDNDLIKKMIKAEAITQFPNLAGEYNTETGEFQGAVKVRRVTPDKEIGEMKNVATGEVTTLGDSKEDEVIEGIDKIIDEIQDTLSYDITGSEIIGDENKVYVLAIAAAHNNSSDKGVTVAEDLVEEKLTIAVAQKIEDLCKKYKNLVVIQTGSTSLMPGIISRESRVTVAKLANPDLCIQIDFNSGEGSGVESYFEYGDGYSESLAQILTDQMSTQMGLENRGIQTQENDSDYYDIIDSYYQTKFPSVITSGGYLENTTDQEILRNGGIDKYAQAIVDGAIEYLTTDHSNTSVTFIKNATESSGIASRVYDLKYVPKEKFEQLVEANSIEALEVFTLDESLNVVTASWKSDGTTLEIITNAPEDLRSALQKVTMPFEYLLYFLIDSGNKDFVMELADMVAETEIIMAVQDNVTTTNIDATVEQRKNASVDEQSTDWAEVESRSKEESSFSETVRTSISITYADTWFVRFSRENDSYSSYSLGAQKEDVIDEIVNVRGKVTEQLNNESGGPYQVGDIQTGTYQKQVVVVEIDEQGNSIQKNETKTFNYTYVIEERYSKDVHIISNDYEEGESVVEENINAFINLYNKYKMANCVKEKWLIQILESNTKTMNMVDLTKYLLYKATGTSYGVEELDFSEYDPNSFINISTGIYGGTVQEKVWFALKSLGLSDYAVAGAMGNIHYESATFDPTMVERGYPFDDAGIGLCQWTNYPRTSGKGRHTNLIKFAEARGKEWTDENIQVEFLKAELTPGGGADGYACYELMTSSTRYDGIKHSPDEWRNATDIETATKIFCYTFERPRAIDANNSMATRISYAEKYYNEFQGRELSSKDGWSTTGVSCPRYYQSDSRWGNNLYNYKSGGTIRSGGCGACALAMAVSGLTGQDVTPDIIVNLLNENGINTIYNGAGSAKLVAETYGLTYEYISRSNKSAVDAALDAGKCCIFSINYNGIYTGGGHFIMCNGRNGDSYYVLESGHYYETDTPYSFDQVFSSGNQGVFVLGR